MLDDHVRHCVREAVDQGPEAADVKIDEALQRGDEGHARELHQRLLPGLVLEHLLGIPWAKRALQIRGVIKSDAYRIASPALQPEDEHELKVLMQDLTPIVPALADAGTQT
jgi:dihydrodipicolinate synthase/N-acetylneuraminate lyase